MKKTLQLFAISFFFAATLTGQNHETSEVQKEEEKTGSFSKLTLGGYGEATYSRNFYSDNVFRYASPADYKNAPSHGRFDLPHVVFFVGYEFGNGWRINSEIEFEHGGTGSAMEIESEEGGEYETEVERGGEVVLEQFWIEKTFSKALSIRLGHIIVPVGLTNGNHLPTQFFTVFRPQGERTIMPSTWHETGMSIWGQVGKWRYEAQLLGGLDSELFGSDRWIGGASNSPYEFKVGNKLATALRVDNYSIPGLRLGVSGYYGQSFNNGIKTSSSDKYKNVKGDVLIGSFDFEYKKHNWIARGYFDYGSLKDALAISSRNRALSNKSASPRTSVGSEALATGVEVGYDIFSQIGKMKQKNQKLYLFGRYEYFDSMYKVPSGIVGKKWCGRQVFVGGLNYFPIKEVVIKAEFSAGLLDSPFKNENAINIGIVYAGFFTK